TAACSNSPMTLAELLDAAKQYDRKLPELVSNGLAVFDEHNLPNNTQWIHQQLSALPPRETPVFRVLDARTREASLQPVPGGLVLLNLVAKRFVQIANPDEPLARSGEVNYHNGRFLSRRVFAYTLPPEWSIFP